MEASYPTDRDTAIKSSMGWLRGKTKDDQCNQLWRVSLLKNLHPRLDSELLEYLIPAPAAPCKKGETHCPQANTLSNH